MSRRLVVFLGGAIMLAMAVLVARMFREHVSPLPGEEVAQVGNSVSGSLQTAPQASLPSPLPPPDAMRMSSGDSAALPVTQVEARPALSAGVAPVVEDSPSGSVQVTEAPVPAAASAGAVELPVAPQDAAPSANREPQAGAGTGSSAEKSPASPASAPAAQPAPKSAAPASGAPARQTAVAPAPALAQSGNKPAASANAGPAAQTGTSATSAAKASAPSSTPSASSASGTSDKALKPGTLVTRSSLPAKAGARIVTAAVLTMDGDVVTLNLQGSDAIQGKAFMLTEPDRVVLDIEGDWKVEVPRVPSNRMVKALRTGSQGKATRLVFDMKVKPVRVNVAKSGASSLELTIR